jgi:hypothetical protein
MEEVGQALLFEISYPHIYGFGAISSALRQFLSGGSMGTFYQSLETTSARR